MPMEENKDMPRSFYLGDDGKPHYFSPCRECDRECKQSFRVIGMYCPYYERKKELSKTKGKKVII